MRVCSVTLGNSKLAHCSSVVMWFVCVRTAEMSCSVECAVITAYLDRIQCLVSLDRFPNLFINISVHFMLNILYVLQFI